MEELAEASDEVETTPETVAEDTLSLEEQLEQARAEAARNLDGWQRTQAEFANARKRFEKQRGEVYINANVELVAKLLPLLDDFERALSAMPEDDKNDPW